MKSKALRWKVLGRVQRVGYRGYLLDLAQQEGVAGYARNEKDGSVTVVAQGEEGALERFARGARSPRPPAMVRGVEESQARPSPRFRYFEVRSSNLAEELQEGFGAMETEFRDYRDEFRDFRQEFGDYRGEFRGFTERTDGNFQRLENKYGEISQKLTEIMGALAEEAKKSKEMLEAMHEESSHGRESLGESLRLLKEAVDRLPRPSQTQ